MTLSLPAHTGRIRQENFEEVWLHPHATQSIASRGRARPEPPCALRTCFQRDRDRILHTKAFRRLKHKTQVFIAPEGDHYRTRLTHTLEVTQISRTVARGLGLNEDLTEAIGLGHDLGHAPFGHAGERVLDTLFVPDGFRHNEQSVRVVEALEPLNLTHEVLDGILHHTGPGTPCTLEGQVVKICDRVAYLNHDLDDALRAGIIQENDLPPWVHTTFGRTRGERIETMVLDLIHHSDLPGRQIRLSDARHDPFLELRAWMFKNIYLGSRAKQEEEKAMGIVARLFQYYAARPDALERAWGAPVAPEHVARTAVDYVSGMTDRYAIATYEKLFLPTPWRLSDESDCMSR